MQRAVSTHVQGMPCTPNHPIASHRARRGRRDRTANVIPCRVLAPVAWNLRGLPEDTRVAHAAAFSIFNFQFLLHFVIFIF